MGHTARDMMSSPVAKALPQESLAHAARLMVERRVGSVLVVDANDHFLGILTENDFVGHVGNLPFTDVPLAQVFGQFASLEGLDKIYREASTRPVEQFMRTDAPTASPGTPIEDVVNLMVAHNVKHIPILEDGKPVGVVARHDLLRILTQNQLASTDKRT